jgi:hypothetical protein
MQSHRILYSIKLVIVGTAQVVTAGVADELAAVAFELGRAVGAVAGVVLFAV